MTKFASPQRSQPGVAWECVCVCVLMLIEVCESLAPSVCPQTIKLHLRCGLMSHHVSDDEGFISAALRGSKTKPNLLHPRLTLSTLSFWKFWDLFFPHYVLLPKVKIRTEQPSGTSGELYSVKHSCSSHDAINNALKCQSVCSWQRFVGSRQELHYSRACTPLQLCSRAWDITQLLELLLC